jgi:hypothetical protein
MARGMTSVKGPTKVPDPSSGMRSDFVLGSRPGVLRAPPINRPTIKPQGAGTRDYGKSQPAPFSTLGQGNTGQGGLS